MARTQKNKATAFHLGMCRTKITIHVSWERITDGCEGQLKAKLAKLKRELLTPSGGGGGGGGKWKGVAIVFYRRLTRRFSWFRCRSYRCCQCVCID